MKRLWVFSIAFAAALSGCGGNPAPAATGKSAPTVSVISPQRGDATLSINLPGDLVGFYEAALHAKVTGYLKSIAVDKGDWVTKGQVLAEIEVPELQQNLDRAHASLEIERLTYDRLKHVRDSDSRLVAQQDVDIARSKWQQAKAEAAALETMVGYTKIVAPFNGVITGRFADPGALIRAGGGDIGMNGIGVQVSPGATEGATTGSQGGPVLTLAQIDQLRTYVYVPEAEVPMIKTGMPAEITFREFPGREFNGTVARFARALDLSTRTMLTEIDIDNPGHRLYPRMYASVTLQLQQHRGVLRLPDSAIGQSKDGDYVMVVRGGKLAVQPISTGIGSEHMTEVTSGLDGSEQVVAAVDPSLAEDEAVNVVQKGSAQSMPTKVANGDP
ncbi:MAG TPA: efflux RND transporter periplasmic adaptor subunit [Candidatus Binataceae bacterium]|nr:efflux RND transporter periplasmic adaptor subunit [Candidatus Binataceae bacterium]